MELPGKFCSDPGAVCWDPATGGKPSAEHTSCLKCNPTPFRRASKRGDSHARWPGRRCCGMRSRKRGARASPATEVASVPADGLASMERLVAALAKERIAAAGGALPDSDAEVGALAAELERIAMVHMEAESEEMSAEEAADGEEAGGSGIQINLDDAAWRHFGCEEDSACQVYIHLLHLAEAG